MLHLFSNYDGEIVAADTLEQAGRYHDCELGGAKEPDSDWKQIPDDTIIPVTDVDETGATERKTAKEWASEFDEPAQFSSTYS